VILFIISYSASHVLSFLSLAAFQLVTMPSRGTIADPRNDDATIVAVSEGSGVAMAHERDMAYWRDALPRIAPLIIDDDEGGIRPSPPVMLMLDRPVASVSIPPLTEPLRTGVVTTAAQFFSKPLEQAAEEKGGKENHTRKSRGPATTTTTSSSDKKKQHCSTTVPVRPPGPSVVAKPEPSAPTVGTVDDFQGDMDDDDDDDLMMQDDDTAVIVPTPIPKAPKTVPATSSSSAPAPCLRKVLVEQTTVDAHGYTRTVHTWREEACRPDALPVKTNKKTTTAPSHMKQGSLKGFFAKK
jgi:hypothetical protein